MNKKNILVITYWDYHDPLIQTYTLPYLKIISKYISGGSIHLALQQKNPLSQNETEQINRDLALWNIQILPLRYAPFGAHAFILWIKNLASLLTRMRRHSLTHIHCWCTPAGMIGYILSRLTGKPLIIDSYEPHAEAMVENGTWKKNSIAFKILFLFEKLQTKRAKALIAAAPGMDEYSKTKYGVKPKVFFVKPACANLEMLSWDNRKKDELLEKFNLKNKIVCVYAGKFGGIYLSNEIFDFFKVAHNYWKDKFRILLLTSHTQEEIEKYCHEAFLDSSIISRLYIPHTEIPAYLGLGDFAITPVKPVQSKKYCSPIKDGEYWALGLPVVITKNISEDSDLIIKHNIGSILEGFTKDNYLKTVKQINVLLTSNSTIELYKKIRPIAEKYRNFNIAERIYGQIYKPKVL